MKFSLALALTLSIAANGAQALSDDLAGKSCKSLEAEMMQFFADNEGGDFRELASGSPISNVVNAAFEGLDERSQARIKGPLVQRFVPFCMRPADYELPKDITVGMALDRAVSLLELDQSAPDWGLPELPELDFATDSCFAFRDANAELSQTARLNPVNDLFRVEVGRFMGLYDLTTPEAQAKSNMAIQMMAFEGAALETEACEAVMARLFAEQGLERN